MVWFGWFALGACTQPSEKEVPGSYEPVSLPAEAEPRAALEDPEPAAPPTVVAAPVPASPVSELVVEKITPGLVRVQVAALTEVGLDLAEGRVAGKSSDSGGWQLSAVGAGTVAARAGLIVDDRIQMINGLPVSDLASLRKAFLLSANGGRLVVIYLRSGELAELEVILMASAEPERLERYDTFTALVGHGVRVLDERHRTIDRVLLEPLARFGAGVRAEDLWLRLGVPDDVSVKLVGGQEVATRSERTFAFTALGSLRTFEITGVDEASKTHVFEYEVTDGGISEHAIERATAGMREVPSRRLRPGASSGEDSGSAEDPKITCEADGRCEMSRADLDAFLASPATLLRQLRILPHLKDGKPIGVKLFGIRPRSLAAQLGFKNGDVLHTINGYTVGSPDKALAAYSKLKDAETLSFALTRRGEDATIELKIIP